MCFPFVHVQSCTNSSVARAKYIGGGAEKPRPLLTIWTLISFDGAYTFTPNAAMLVGKSDLAWAIIWLIVT